MRIRSRPRTPHRTAFATAALATLALPLPAAAQPIVPPCEPVLNHHQELRLVVDLPPAEGTARYVAWLATPALDRISMLGTVTRASPSPRRSTGTR